MTKAEIIALAERCETTAFLTAEQTRQVAGESEIKFADRTYNPSFPGVHFCGADDEDNRAFTIADFAFRSNSEATEMWKLLKSTCCSGDDGDMLVDLNLGPYNAFDDFWTTRQLVSVLPRSLMAIAEEMDG